MGRLPRSHGRRSGRGHVNGANDLRLRGLRLVSLAICVRGTDLTLIPRRLAAFLGTLTQNEREDYPWCGGPLLSLSAHQIVQCLRRSAVHELGDTMSLNCAGAGPLPAIKLR